FPVSVLFSAQFFLLPAQSVLPLSVLSVLPESLWSWFPLGFVSHLTTFLVFPGSVAVLLLSAQSRLPVQSVLFPAPVLSAVPPYSYLPAWTDSFQTPSSYIRVAPPRISVCLSCLPTSPSLLFLCLNSVFS